MDAIYSIHPNIIEIMNWNELWQFEFKIAFQRLASAARFTHHRGEYQIWFADDVPSYVSYYNYLRAMNGREIYIANAKELELLATAFPHDAITLEIRPGWYDEWASFDAHRIGN